MEATDCYGAQAALAATTYGGAGISPEATEALLRWLNGIPDESWREDHE